MKKKKIAIFGAGGLGREVLWIIQGINLKDESYDILGFVDDTPALQNKTVNNFPVLGDSSWLLNYHGDIGVVIAIGASQARKGVFEKFSHLENIYFPSIIAGDAKYSDSVSIGRGCVIGFYSLLTVNITLGDFVLLNGYCSIGHDARIGNFATLYGNASVSGNVSIGECAEIGAGARILQKKSIGENSKVGIGSVVVTNVQPNCTVFGNPAKKIM